MPASVPAVSGRTAVTAAVLSLVGGAVFTAGVVAGVIGVLDPGLPEDERIISAVVGALAFPLAAVVLVVVVLIIAYSAVTIILAMVSATARWCQARGASRDDAIPVPATGWAPLAFEAVPASGSLTAAPVAGSKKVWVMAAASGAVLVLASGTALAFTFTLRQPAATSGAPGSATTAPKHPAYGEQVTLPFEGIRVPGRVAVDINATVYVTDYPHSDDSSDKMAPGCCPCLPGRPPQTRCRSTGS